MYANLQIWNQIYSVTKLKKKKKKIYLKNNKVEIQGLFLYFKFYLFLGTFRHLGGGSFKLCEEKKTTFEKGVVHLRYANISAHLAHGNTH